VSGIRQALLLGGIPVVVAAIYFFGNELFGSQEFIDPAGGTLLVALGMAMGFGMLVILRGARDI
jgi:hypothetical protein